SERPLFARQSGHKRRRDASFIEMGCGNQSLRHSTRANISNGFRYSTVMTLATRVDSILQGFGVHRDHYRGGERTVRSPLTGETTAHVSVADANSLAEAIERWKRSSLGWPSFPAPRRGELVGFRVDELR